MLLKQTPSQTIGPFFSYGLTPKQAGYNKLSSLASSSLVTESTIGAQIRIEGTIFDGVGDIVSDAMVEIWQADSQGRYQNQPSLEGIGSSFLNFGRCDTGANDQNKFVFETVKPGQISTKTAPHINLVIFMRGLLSHVFTRIYFPDEKNSNLLDETLLTIPAYRQETLVAKKLSGESTLIYEFNIHLQGEKETVFFDA